MKKILITLSAITVFFTAQAQNKTVEKWPNGNKRSEGVVLGEAKIDANDSKEVRARKLNNIVKDGKWTTWYEDGTVRSEENYNKGMMTGVWKTWYNNSQLESEINFTAGKAIFYNKNGTKSSEGGMITGMVHTGKWIGYFESGKKNYEGTYTADGQKTGVWMWWNENGVETNEQTYQNGALISSKELTER